MKQKPSNQTVEWIKDGAVLVDVRTPEEFSAGSVPDALNIPLSEIANHVDELNKKDKIIVFCRSGNRSGQAKSILNNNGVDQVINGGSWTTVNEAYQEANSTQ